MMLVFIIVLLCNSLRMRKKLAKTNVVLAKQESVVRLRRERNEAASRADKLTKELEGAASARDAAVDR